MNAATRAAVIGGFGAPDVFTIAEVAVADAGPGQVRVAVAHSAVNPIDLGTREGRTVPVEHARFPMVLGWDADGVVDQVGAGVDDLHVGDRVFLCTQQPVTQAGTHADLIVVAADAVAPAPSTDAGTHGRAAALGLAGITAYQALRTLDLQDGDTVLINNPVGFVGSLATQIARAHGATVIATTTDELAPKAGAVDHLIITDSTSADRVDDDAPRRIRALAEGGVDAALDLLGGPSARRTFSSVRDEGRYATVLPEWWVGGGIYQPARGITPAVVENDPNRRDLQALAELADRGHLDVTIADTFSLDQVAHAHAALASSGVFGKLVIQH